MKAFDAETNPLKSRAGVGFGSKVSNQDFVRI
jgi:hypothetical protein